MSTRDLDKLEKRVTQVVAVMSTIQAENQKLRKEITELRQSLEEIRKDNSIKNRRIQQFRKDRLKIRSRVEKILERVNALDQPNES